MILYFDFYNNFIKYFIVFYEALNNSCVIMV